MVALNQACEGVDKRWFSSTLELQRVSLDFCRACRSFSNLLIKVGPSTPHNLWTIREPLPQRIKRSNATALDTRSRVPEVRPLALTFWGNINSAIAGATSSSSVRSITSGDSFDAPVGSVVWPAFVQQVKFGPFFDQPIVGVA